MLLIWQEQPQRKCNHVSRAIEFSLTKGLHHNQTSARARQMYIQMKSVCLSLTLNEVNRSMICFTLVNSFLPIQLNNKWRETFFCNSLIRTSRPDRDSTSFNQLEFISGRLQEREKAIMSKLASHSSSVKACVMKLCSISFLRFLKPEFSFLIIPWKLKPSLLILTSDVRSSWTKIGSQSILVFSGPRSRLISSPCEICYTK